MNHVGIVGTVLVVLSITAAIGCSRSTESSEAAENNTRQIVMSDTLAKATFAGGCFWCMEPPYDKIDGVLSTTSGYTGGEEENPTYEEVSSGSTGHAEAVQIVYDPDKVSYEKLLNIFWHNIDPTTPNRQFCDVGSQYRPAIFYHDEEQKRLAEQTKQKLKESGRFSRVAVEVQPLTDFYPAEKYHQNFYQKNPVRYKRYRTGCGRDQRLQELWGEKAPEASS